MNEKEFQDLVAKVGEEAAKKIKEQFEALEKKQKEELDAAVKGMIKAEELEALKEEHKKQLDKLEDALRKQGEVINELKEKGVDGFKSHIMKALEDNKDKIKSFLGKETKTLTIEVKAAQNSTDILDHTLGYRVPGIGQIPVRAPFIEDIFPTVNVSSEFIRYIDQNTVVRDAKNVAGCATSTHNTKITWKEYNIQITKVRDFIDVCVDMMEDYDFVEGEIRNLVNSSVQLKVDSGLLMGDGVYPNLHSIDEVSSEFDASNTLGGTIEAWTGKVQDPNIFDLVIAMASQIVALGEDNSYMPDTVLWNTIDKYKSMLVKDANGQYLLPPFVVRVGDKEYTIDGMRVRANPSVPANSMYVFDSTKGTIYNRKGITLEMAYENRDNFEHEMVTIKAYRRLQLLVRNVNKNAFMKSTDVAAAITAITKA